MTNKEAMSLINKALTQGKITQEMESYSFLYAIKDAIEKQIPKKPVGSAILLEGGGAKCPACGKAFCTESWKTKHCCICGQALNWSDDDNCDHVIEVEPVIHAHWIRGQYDYENVPQMIDDKLTLGKAVHYHCSNCRCVLTHMRRNYCPDCGAKMDWSDEND